MAAAMRSCAFRSVAKEAVWPESTAAQPPCGRKSTAAQPPCGPKSTAAQLQCGRKSAARSAARAIRGVPLYAPLPCRMLDQHELEQSPIVRRVTFALAVSGITAATVTGMLLGLGRRYSTLWRPLNAAAHTVLGSRADGVWGFQFVVTLTGVGVVLVMSTMTGVVIAELTSSGRTLHRAIVAFGMALAGYLVHVHIVARTPGGLASLLTLGELRALYFAVAIAVVLGMRYAFPPFAGTPRQY